MPSARLLISWLLLAVALSWGCDRRTAAPDVGGSERDTSAVDVDEPQRIVSLAPSVTETLFALGVGERVVAVTRFCDFPSRAEKLPKIGGLTDVDVELVLSLQPDLVVGVQNQTARALERTLERAEVETLFLPVENLGQVRDSIGTLGSEVGASDRAQELVQSLKPPDVPPREPVPGVLVLFGRDPWIAAGPGTFADELIRLGGGRNVLSDAQSPYPTLDAERLGSLRPDLVIDTAMGAAEGKLPTGGEPRVVKLDAALMRPGPRLEQAMRRFRSAIDEVRGGE